MAQYQTGTVDVTGASQTVDGNSTLWVANVSIGDVFKISEIDATYAVGAVVSDTEITLTSSWAGTTLVGQNYQIVKDSQQTMVFVKSGREIKDWPFHLTETIRAIDTELAISVVDQGVITTLNLTVSDLNTVHLLKNTATLTVNLPSVDSSNVGSWISLKKRAAGYVSINPADSDVIDGELHARMLQRKHLRTLLFCLKKEQNGQQKKSLATGTFQKYNY